MDEMWSFYHDKGHQIWLWWAVDHETNTPLAYVFGTRKHRYLDKLLELLKPLLGQFMLTIILLMRVRLKKQHLSAEKRIHKKLKEII